MNVIGDLLRIKEFREDRAEMAVSRARAELEEKTRALERARDELQAFRDECVRRERQLYADLCARLCRLSDINDLTLEIESMRGGVNEREEKVAAAQQARKVSVERLEQAREAHREALRVREKFTELSVQDRAERSVEMARLEDLELEEVSTRPRLAALADEDDSTTEALA